MEKWVKCGTVATHFLPNPPEHCISRRAQDKRKRGSRLGTAPYRLALTYSLFDGSYPSRRAKTTPTAAGFKIANTELLDEFALAGLIDPDKRVTAEPDMVEA